ncbi:MAG TPA: hypothetical protein VN748_11355 [Pseudonocardiaceae bacterium]|nr:hypothetical protein [Pseudonocardiaceae bacterium]
MSEPWPDALFGVDGTESPVPPDRSRRPDAAVPPPFVLPPIPPLGMTREAVAATFGDDLGLPLPPEPAASPSTAPASPATPLPVAPIPQPETPPSGAPVYNQRPIIAPMVSPTQPLARGGGGLRYRQPLMAGSRSLKQLRNTRRLVVRRLPRQSRSNGGAGAFFLIMSITIAVLLYFIISGIVEAFARLIP